MIPDRYGGRYGGRSQEINPKIRYVRISSVMFVCLSAVLGSLSVGSKMLTNHVYKFHLVC